jgi:hypothetical protein
MQDNPENYDIEVLAGNESEIIEMVSGLFFPPQLWQSTKS